MTSEKAFLCFIWSLVGSVFLSCITFFLAFNLFQYSGDLHVRAQFYTVGSMDSSRQMDVVPFEGNNNKDRLLQLDEMLIRYYIEMRYSSIPDKIEMARRWYKRSFFANLASSTIYEDFIPDLDKALSKLSPAVRTVDIIDVHQDSVKKDKRGNDIYTYTIDFDIYARTIDGEVVPDQKKRVVLRISHQKRRIYWNKKFNSPYGLTVGTNPYGFFIGEFSEEDRN